VHSTLPVLAVQHEYEDCHIPLYEVGEKEVLFKQGKKPIQEKNVAVER